MVTTAGRVWAAAGEVPASTAAHVAGGVSGQTAHLQRGWHEPEGTVLWVNLGPSLPDLHLPPLQPGLLTEQSVNTREMFKYLLGCTIT